MLEVLIFFVSGAAFWHAVRALIEARRRERFRQLVLAQNLNDVARELALLEGGKKPQTVAQIKEFIACLGTHTRTLPEERGRAVLEAIRQRGGLSSRTR